MVADDHPDTPPIKQSEDKPVAEARIGHHGVAWLEVSPQTQPQGSFAAFLAAFQCATSHCNSRAGSEIEKADDPHGGEAQPSLLASRLSPA